MSCRSACGASFFACADGQNLPVDNLEVIHRQRPDFDGRPRASGIARHAHDEHGSVSLTVRAVASRVEEAAMWLRPNRRNLVVYRSSARRADRYRIQRPTRAQRIRRLTRMGALLAILGVLRLSALGRRRWPLLAGIALTAVGVALRAGPGGVLLLHGL